MADQEHAAMHVPPLRIAVTYNERKEDSEKQAERLSLDYVKDVRNSLRELEHDAELLEVSGDTPDVLRRIDKIGPELVFNLAEGEHGVWREALYPMIFEILHIPYTGAGPGTLALGLDKRLTEEVLTHKGVRVPKGRLLTPEVPGLPDDLDYPLIFKPNYEGSSIGIHQESIIENKHEAEALLTPLLEQYPDGINAEEYIRGRELTVGYLAAKKDPFTKIVEYRFPQDRHNILDYETKQKEGNQVETLCPAPLTPNEHQRIMGLAARAISTMNLLDFGRIDLRLCDDGEPYLIEVNPLAGMRRFSPLVVGAKQQGLSYTEIIGLIVASAAKRYGLIAEVVPT